VGNGTELKDMGFNNFVSDIADEMLHESDTQMGEPEWQPGFSPEALTQALGGVSASSNHPDSNKEIHVDADDGDGEFCSMLQTLPP
jgi:hypothetical protein